jgi:alpha-2-macroglobulin-like protein
LFFGSGPSRRIETTALAALALANAGQSFDSVRGALAWLIAAKDGQGTWASTQATVLALKALLAGTGKPLGGDKPRRIVILLDGEIVQELAISADQADVVRQVDLSDRIAKVPWTRRLTIEDRSGTDSCYQVVFRYHEPDKLDRAAAKSDGMPFTISLHFDRTLMAVDETATAVVSVVNNRPEPAPMVILDLPIPAGFAIDGDELAALVDAGSIEKFQVSARAAIVYLRDLKPGVLLTVRYRLRATMPVKLAVPPARVYEYYDPSREGSSRSVGLLVTAKR